MYIYAPIQTLQVYKKTDLLPSQPGLPDGKHIFLPKIPILIYFGGPYRGKFWYIVWSFGRFNEDLVYFVMILEYFWSFDIFSQFWYAVPRKNLATLVSTYSCLVLTERSNGSFESG
jgi:hypothetical protein